MTQASPTALTVRSLLVAGPRPASVAWFDTDAGPRRATVAWFDTDPRLRCESSLYTRIVTRSKGAAYKYCGPAFRGLPTDNPCDLAPAGSEVHVVAQLALDGHNQWVWVHEGVATELSVPKDVRVNFTVTMGDRLYRDFAPDVSGVCGYGALAGFARCRPTASRAPATLVLDPARGVVRAGDTHPTVNQCWDPGLTWDGDTIRMTASRLGRDLRDRCDPRSCAVDGGWAPWAWDALEDYARQVDVSAGEVARGALCAAVRHGELVTLDHVRAIATLDGCTTAHQVATTARCLAGELLTTDDLVTALVGILAH